jgi:hypothetical protein
MSRRDVADFMSQHTSQLRLITQIRQDPASQIDEATWQRKGIHRWRINDRKLPRKVRSMGERRESKPDFLDIPLDARIAVDPHVTLDLGISLLTQRDFLGLTHQDELAIAGHRVRGARIAHQQQPSNCRRNLGMIARPEWMNGGAVVILHQLSTIMDAAPRALRIPKQETEPTS